MVNQASSTLAKRIRSFLGRLARNRAGNVLAITAAIIPPILVLVGGGVDMSRAYMTQTALQNACDAGVLAGRRAQAKTGAWTATEIGKANRMFNFNFAGTAASAAASSTVFTPTNAGSGVVSGTATTTMPTTIMKMFGTNSFTLTATCSAEFQVSNIDVMMILDTTGSMACEPDGTDCYSGTTSKIEGLKSAIRSFYTTIATAVPAGGNTRVRFGFVPYNGTVNLTNLVSGATPAIPQSYLTSATNYQTKLYRFDQPVYTPTVGAPSSVNQTYGSQITQDECNSYASNLFPTTSTNPVIIGTAPGDVTTVTYSFVSWINNCGNCQGNQGNGNGNIPKGTCTRQRSTVVTTYALTAYGLNPTTPYRYEQASLDTATLKARTAVNLATAVASTATIPAAAHTTDFFDMVTLGAMSGTTNVTKTSVTWNGCIEERDTVDSLITASSVPAGARDLDLVSAPTGSATQWRPYIPELTFDRNQRARLDTNINYGSMTSYCPPAALNYTTVNTSAPATVPSWLETYLGTLYAWGGTYHDIGMIWGTRLASPNGINAATVNAGNLSAISRHIIFLTDGEMAPNCKGLYAAYGQEYLDDRVMPVQPTTDWTCNATLTTYHNGRYLAACKAARDMGFTIWVIGFGQALTAEMTACAAGSGGQAMSSGSSEDLADDFREIASRIADLRLKT